MRPAVIFDFDGVVADSGPVITECIDLVLASRGFARPAREELLACVGQPLLTSPRPRPSAEALEHLGRPDPVMVGDRSSDGARADGVPAIGVTWGAGSRHELETAGVDRRQAAGQARCSRPPSSTTRTTRPWWSVPA